MPLNTEAAKAKAIAKAEALHNSVPLDVHCWSTYPRVNNAVDALFDDLTHDPNFGGSERLKKKHIKVVILDLWLNWIVDHSRYKAYSRNRNGYQGKSRYNELFIGFLTVSVVDALEARGYIEHHQGYFDHDEGEGRFSRMRATDKLIKFIRDRYEIPIEAVERHRNAECIILRNKIDGKKKDVDYTDTAATFRMRRNLTAYNELLARTQITIPDAPPDGIPSDAGKRRVVLAPANKFVRRIFNDDTWKHGGRFYGGWWQGISEEWRGKIFIGDPPEPTIEVDYSGLHIVLLYAKRGIDYWQTDGIDPYQIEGIERSQRMRNFLKQILLTIINAEDQLSGLRAIRKEINLGTAEYEWVKNEQVDWEGLVDAFVDRHEPIRKDFYSNSGVKLQRIDSDMAAEIIDHFTKWQVPILCIHDSFIVAVDHEEELKDLMRKVMKGATRKVSNGRVEVDPILK